MRYEFVDRNGVQFVRIAIGTDVIERVATEADHKVAAEATAAEDALAEALAQETKERIERENANEQRAFGNEPAAAPVSQKALEKEFDKQLAHELGEDDGKNGHKKKPHKAAE